MKSRTGVIVVAAFIMALVALRLHYGAAAVALVSASLALPWAKLRSSNARWSLALLAPLAVTFALYGLHWWMLTVTGPYPEGYVGSYAAWALFGLAEWGAAGIVASVIATGALAAARARGVGRS